MTVKKLRVDELKAMVKEAIATQLKEAKAKKTVKENKSIKVTASQLKEMVRTAVKARLSESMGEVPGLGDLVAYNGTTGFVEDVSPDGRIGVTRDGLKMDVVMPDKVRVLATAEDLRDLSPEEVASLSSDMNFDVNHDPGEEPNAEFDRIGDTLSNGLLAKSTRVPLAARKRELGVALGKPEMDIGEASTSPKGDGGKISMTFGTFPPDEQWAELVLRHGRMNFRLGDSDYRALEEAAAQIGLSGHEAQNILMHMGDPEAVKNLLDAMVMSSDEGASLASSFVDQLGIEWI